MKRELTGIRQCLEAAIKRLEDLEKVYPEMRHSIETILDMELRRSLSNIDYLLELSD